MNRWPHSVSILTPGGSVEDDYGNPTTTWTTVEVEGMFQPGPGAEATNMADFQIGDGVLFLPIGTAISGDSRVEVLGRTYEVEGPPEVWLLGGPLDHVRALLRYVTG